MTTPSERDWVCSECHAPLSQEDTFLKVDEHFTYTFFENGVAKPIKNESHLKRICLLCIQNKRTK